MTGDLVGNGWFGLVRNGRFGQKRSIWPRNGRFSQNEGLLKDLAKPTVFLNIHRNGRFSPQKRSVWSENPEMIVINAKFDRFLPNRPFLTRPNRPFPTKSPVTRNPGGLSPLRRMTGSFVLQRVIRSPTVDLVFHRRLGLSLRSG